MQKEKLLQQLLETYQGDTAAILRDLEAWQQALTQQPKKTVIDRSDKPVLVDVQNLGKTYKLGKTKVDAVKDVSLQVHEGEIVALVGTSGSGKSTVLNLIGGLDKPTRGTVVIDGVDIKKLSDRKLSKYRGNKIGFVFQFFYLQPFLNVQDNVELPTMFSRLKKQIRHERATKAAQDVSLTDRLRHLPKELSGGQMQRAAIARALMNQPKILLADEPTGNLDQTNALAIFDLFETVRQAYGTTVIVVTHDEALAAKADRIIRLSDGEVAA